MAEIDILSNLLGISPKAISRNLGFIKESHLSDLWHIGDFTELVEDKAVSPDFLLILALHGGMIPKVVEASSLIEISLKEINPIMLCSSCVDEFRFAFPDIQNKPDWAFIAPMELSSKLIH